jgi:hypothetical protein
LPGVWQRILAGVFLAGHQPIHIDTHGGGLWDHRRLTESIGLVRRHPDHSSNRRVVHSLTECGIRHGPKVLVPQAFPEQLQVCLDIPGTAIAESMTR